MIKDEDIRTFGFLLIPGFSLVALSCAIDVLRAANVEYGQKYYTWKLLGDDCSSQTSSSGIMIPCKPISHINPLDGIAICGGERSHLYQSSSTINWLKEQARNGSIIGSLSDGAYIAAAAGLFDNCRSTIHWKCQSGYREIFPDIDIRTSIFEIDRHRFSCAGGTASLDLFLRFVSSSMGYEIAGLVADNYFHDIIRGDDQLQHATSALRFATRNKTLSKALLMMETALETPHSIEQIASETGVSHRQLDRLFRANLKTSPSGHYRDLRLVRASGLLKQTHLSVSEIALACGFQTASHLAKFFTQKFEKSPLQYRRSR